MQTEYNNQEGRHEHEGFRPRFLVGVPVQNSTTFVTHCKDWQPKKDVHEDSISNNIEKSDM